MISFAIGGGAFEIFGYGCYPYGCEAHALDVIQLWKRKSITSPGLILV